MRLPRILLSIVLLATLCAISHAETRTIWEIGKPDRDFAELAIPRDFSSYPNVFPKDVTFRAGKDSPAKAWPFIHPGPQDAWAGMRVHPFTIAFDLPEEPRGSFKLSINMVSTHSSFAPTYEVKINDRADTIALPAGQSDAALTDPSKGKPYALNLTLPASYFRKGANTLLLQTIQGSWLLYDALSLTNDPDAAITEPTINSIDLTPTMRFVRRGNKLRQVVQAVASFSSVAAGRAATITANGKTQSVILNSNLLGVASTDIEVDEVSKPTQITMKLASGGQTRSASCELKPQKHWVLYVQASAHVDIGYTDLQERVAKVHNGNMDTALDLCRQYPDFKWNTEAAWVESNYLSTATKERKAEFIKRAQEGRIGCQAVFGNML
ncbi:MAG TPA: polysaccharide lyase family protein, partial [Chloroflexota bacterium]|nr:polysaccharide lyase family protein [Chloroflexota bacterium]